MKKICILFTLFMLIFALAGCNGNNPSEFPQDVQPVDVFDSNSSTPNNEDIGNQFDYSKGDDQLNISLEDLNLSNITVEDVIEWYSGQVSSEYVESESDGGSLVTQTASLKTGGYISISSYHDIYFNTAFSYNDISNSDILHEKSVAFLKIYLERNLTAAESASLKASIESSLKSIDVVYVEEFLDTLPIYISVSNSTFSIVCP